MERRAEDWEGDCWNGGSGEEVGSHIMPGLSDFVETENRGLRVGRSIVIKTAFLQVYADLINDST